MAVPISSQKYIHLSFCKLANAKSYGWKVFKRGSFRLPVSQCAPPANGLCTINSTVYLVNLHLQSAAKRNSGHEIQYEGGVRADGLKERHNIGVQNHIRTYLCNLHCGKQSGFEHTHTNRLTTVSVSTSCWSAVLQF